MVNHGKSMMVNRDDFSGAEYGEYIINGDEYFTKELTMVDIGWYYSTISYPMNHICQGCSQHPKYKGGNLVDKVVKWPNSLSCGYNLHTMDWSNHGNTESTSPISISPSPSQHIMGGIPTIPSHASPSSFEVQYTIWVPLDSKVSL